MRFARASRLVSLWCALVDFTVGYRGCVSLLTFLWISLCSRCVKLELACTPFICLVLRGDNFTSRGVLDESGSQSIRLKFYSGEHRLTLRWAAEGVLP